MVTFENILLALGIMYSAFICWCMWGWLRRKYFAIAETDDRIFFSVILPARNEAENIIHCLESLRCQDYPKEYFEVIVADDDSEDDTARLVNDFIKEHSDLQCKLIQPSSSGSTLYKKAAISDAIKVASGMWIVTTDADCLLSKRWLSSINSLCQSEKPAMISGPVAIAGEKTFLEKFQSLEFMGLVGIGAATLTNGIPMMCNGANLAYDKDVFQKEGGYENEKFASGDDTQLMMKFNKAGAKISFLKSYEACVFTKGKPALSELIQQRTRWTSKIPLQMSGFTQWIAAVAWLLHAGIVISVFFSLFLSPLWIYVWLLKVSAEFVFLFILSGFFRKRNNLLYFLPAQVIYPFYITILGLKALRGDYEWKGRVQSVR